jgi:hypothetical protein
MKNLEPGAWVSAIKTGKLFWRSIPMEPRIDVANVAPGAYKAMVGWMSIFAIADWKNRFCT